MPLLMQDYASIIEALRAKAADGSSGSERRSTQRMAIQAPIEILPLSGPHLGDVVKVLTVDISPESLGILSARSIDPQHSFLAMLPRRNKTAIVALFHSMRLTAIADGVYSIGAVLKADQPNDVLSALAGVQNPRVEPMREALRKLAGVA